MGIIREKLVNALPSPRQVSWKSGPEKCRVVFTLRWDLIGFFREQGYKEEFEQIIERAITVTGSETDAQASTCASYMSQTWPVAGSDMIRLIQTVVRDEHGIRKP